MERQCGQEGFSYTTALLLQTYVWPWEEAAKATSNRSPEMNVCFPLSARGSPSIFMKNVPGC